MTNFEDELREALAVDDRPVNQLGVARYDFAMKHQKSHTIVIEDAAELLLDILPEIREMVEARSKCDFDLLTVDYYEHGGARIYTERTDEKGRKERGLKFDCYGDACNREFLVTALKPTLTEKLKKAGVV